MAYAPLVRLSLPRIVRWRVVPVCQSSPVTSHPVASFHPLTNTISDDVLTAGIMLGELTSARVHLASHLFSFVFQLTHSAPLGVSTVGPMASTPIILSEDIPKYSMEEELATADKSLMMMDVKWNAYYGSWQNVIADNDSLLQIVADYQLIKQNIQDSISAKRHYIQSLEDFTVAETFLSAQDSVYEKFHTDALEYSLIKQLAPQLEQLKGKEQILFAEIQEHYEKAKAAAEEFNELQPRINKIEQRYIDLKNTSDKIQALEYKPWFQRIKDYLFGLAAVSMILLFVNALQSKIQMLKQTRENAKKLKQMQNKEEDDYPSI